MRKVQFSYSWITVCLAAILVIFNACETEMTDAELLESDMERMDYSVIVENEEKVGTKEYASVYAYIDSEGGVYGLNSRVIKSSGDENTDFEILESLEHANFLHAVEGTKNGKEVIFEVTRYYYFNPEMHQGIGETFIPYDEPPKPVGGFSALREKIKYPEVAQKNGIEGVVVVQGFIDSEGNMSKFYIVKGVPDCGLNSAAVSALEQTKFEPAKQKEQPIGVWISIPIVFKLHDSKEDTPQSINVKNNKS